MGVRLDGTPPRTVYMEAPNVETTGGGKQARQSVLLVAADGRKEPPLVVGFIDVGASNARLLAEHEWLRLLGSEAAARGVMLLPGVGFGVVPTESRPLRLSPSRSRARNSPSRPTVRAQAGSP